MCTRLFISCNCPHNNVPACYFRAGYFEGYNWIKVPDHLFSVNRVRYLDIKDVIVTVILLFCLDLMLKHAITELELFINLRLTKRGCIGEPDQTHTCFVLSRSH